MRLKHSITGNIHLADDYSINIDKLFEEALKEVYGDALVEEAKKSLSPSLFKLTNEPLQHAVDSVFAEPEFGSPDQEFLNEFKYNTGVFAAFKAHAEQELLVSLLLDEKGNLRSFHEFRKAVKGLNIKWNEQWLRTEYNTAVRSARAAANYRDALRSKDMYPNLEYMMSNARDKREEHLGFVGTILPIEHPFWDVYLPPSEWNCKCSVRPTDKEPTEEPIISEEIPSLFRNNPGKTAEFIKLKEHPYIKGKGIHTCPECRRQGIVSGGTGEELCQMHRLAKETAELAELIEERRQKYEELIKDLKYIEVKFNSKNGALMATHVEHNFDKEKGWYEKKVQEVGYNAGNEVIFKEELGGKIGQRFTEGTWNGKKFEIGAAEQGTPTNVRNKLKHCASKREAKTAVIFYPDASKYSLEDFERGLRMYNGLKGDPYQYVDFEEIYIIVDNNIIKIK